MTVEGLPSMVLESRIAIHDEDDTDQALPGHCHAFGARDRAGLRGGSGIRTFLDLPTILGRGVLSKGLGS